MIRVRNDYVIEIWLFFLLCKVDKFEEIGVLGSLGRKKLEDLIWDYLFV